MATGRPKRKPAAAAVTSSAAPPSLARGLDGVVDAGASAVVAAAVAAVVPGASPPGFDVAGRAGADDEEDDTSAYPL
jgi:hypothetical protein